MARARTSPSEARQRLLETADRLFYRHGVRAVGIDTVIAEAGVAKMTLYTHFPSKDDLIVAVLRYREEQVLAFFTRAIDRRARRTDRLRAFFAALREWFGSPDFRGCAFQNAAVELADPAHPGTEFVRGHKRRFTDLIRGFVEESVGGRGAAKLVPAIALLVEGAVVTAVIQGSPDPATTARDAALKLVETVKGA
jgi:AcrR family transcriptional regulator